MTHLAQCAIKPRNEFLDDRRERNYSELNKMVVDRVGVCISVVSARCSELSNKMTVDSVACISSAPAD